MPDLASWRVHWTYRPADSMTEARLEAWFNGELADDELTLDEVKDLEARVFDAITAKIFHDESKITFAQHDTLQ